MQCMLAKQSQVVCLTAETTRMTQSSSAAICPFCQIEKTLPPQKMEHKETETTEKQILCFLMFNFSKYGVRLFSKMDGYHRFLSRNHRPSPCHVGHECRWHRCPADSQRTRWPGSRSSAVDTEHYETLMSNVISWRRNKHVPATASHT